MRLAKVKGRGALKAPSPVQANTSLIIRKPTSTHTQNLYWRKEKKEKNQCWKKNFCYHFFGTESTVSWKMSFENTSHYMCWYACRVDPMGWENFNTNSFPWPKMVFSAITWYDVISSVLSYHPNKRELPRLILKSAVINSARLEPTTVSPTKISQNLRDAN